MIAIVVKQRKRLHIIDYGTGDVLYTPPDFLRLVNRDRLRSLAEAFTRTQSRDISAIMEFERATPCRARPPRST